MDIQLNEPTNLISMKVPKVVKPTNKMIIKLWGLVNKQPNVPSLLPDISYLEGQLSWMVGVGRRSGGDGWFVNGGAGTHVPRLYTT